MSDKSIILEHISDLQPGDLLILGKRRWVYACRSEEDERYAHQQNEYLFCATASTESMGALGDHRVFSQSELEALAVAGFLHRAVIMQISMKNHRVGNEQT